MSRTGLQLLASGSLALLVSGSSFASDYLEFRKERSKEQMRVFDSKRMPVAGDEFMLFTLARPISESELLKMVSTQDIKLAAVYVCDDIGGVFGYLLDEGKPPAPQLGKKVVMARNAILAEQGAPSTNAPDLSRPQVKQSEYCGFDVQGGFLAVNGIIKSLGGSFLMSELTTRRIRMLPVNAKIVIKGGEK